MPKACHFRVHEHESVAIDTNLIVRLRIAIGPKAVTVHK